MRKVVLFFCLALMSLPAVAEILTCDALIARVDAKLQAKGISSYTLEIIAVENANAANATAVPATKTPEGKEIGTCGGGTKRLIYTKGM